MSDGEGGGTETDSDADARAAIDWAALEVVDLTSLRRSGFGYMKPGEKGPYLNGRIGWPFMSWVLRSWVRAGLVQVYADASTEPDEELRAFGWLDRAIPDRRWLNLLPVDAEALVSNFSLWGPTHVAGQFELILSEAGRTTPSDEFARVALASDEPRPALGQHPDQLEQSESDWTETDWEALSVRMVFPGSGAPGRVVWRPCLYLVRLREPERDLWARVLAETEKEIRAVSSEVDIWLEADALADDDLSPVVEKLRKTRPSEADKGITFRTLD